MAKVDLQDVKRQLDAGCIVSKATWLEVLAYAMELEDAQKPKEYSEGWIDYDGSRQPVDDDVMVQVELRDGILTGYRQAEYFDWSIDNNCGDIIRYRIKA